MTEHKRITDEELLNYEELCDGATPGPWRPGDIAHPKGVDGPNCRQAITAASHGIVAQTFGGQWRRKRRPGELSNYPDIWGDINPNGDMMLEDRSDPDAEFIARARTAVPRLLAEVKELSRLLRAAKWLIRGHCICELAEGHCRHDARAKMKWLDADAPGFEEELKIDD